MALHVSDESLLLTRALSGLGVDEKALISTLGKWHPEQKKSFRKETPCLFMEDDRLFERWDDQNVTLLTQEFLRFQKAVLLWTMHPWERDARLMKEALNKGPQAYDAIIEVACTRSSEELLGARKAYHALFHHSIEEEVAHQVNAREGKLLVALVSSYRYEGPKVANETAKVEAKNLYDVLRKNDKKGTTEEEDVVRILSTRSKHHLQAMYRYYEEICPQNIKEDLNVDFSLKATMQCLCTPRKYFTRALDKALRDGADESTKEALTRVIITRADVDLKEIIEEYHNQYGASLSTDIAEIANGNYKEFLLTLLER